MILLEKANGILMKTIRIYVYWASIVFLTGLF